MTLAAVSLYELRGYLLVVWNRRYTGWMLPGGRVEEGETPDVAQARELREETGLTTLTRTLVFEGPHDLTVGPKRATHVRVYRVTCEGTPYEAEKGCPIQWMRRKQFLAVSPVRAFYTKVFEKVPPLQKERTLRGRRR